MPKGLPRRGWKEMDINTINYLREVVELKKEVSNRLPVKKDQRPVKARQIRKAVKRRK